MLLAFANEVILDGADHSRSIEEYDPEEGRRCAARRRCRQDKIGLRCGDDPDCRMGEQHYCERPGTKAGLAR